MPVFLTGIHGQSGPHPEIRPAGWSTNEPGQKNQFTDGLTWRSSGHFSNRRNSAW